MFSDIDINLDIETVKNDLSFITGWIEQDHMNRKAEITMEYGYIKIWIHDFSMEVGMYISKADKIQNVDDINNILKAKKEKEEKMKYEELKAKFENKGDKIA